MTITVKIPAKIMLAGEYAVLNGFDSLSVTLDNYLTAKIKKTTKKGWAFVESDIFTQHISFNYTKELQSNIFLANSIYTLIQENLNHFLDFGINISFSSTIKIKDGIGSSSALLLAAAIALHSITTDALQTKATTDLNFSNQVRQALQIQKRAQPTASGYDVITQLNGGIVLYNIDRNISVHKDDIYISKLESIIQPYSGGAGAPTAFTMQNTLQWLTNIDVELKNSFYANSQQLCKLLLEYITTDNDLIYNEIIHTTAFIQNIFSNSPKFPVFILQKFKNLSGFNKTWSFKTTGAGGEDAIILIGKKKYLTQANTVLLQLGWSKLGAKFTNQGTSVSFN